MKLTAIVSTAIFATAIFAAPQPSHGRARALKQRANFSTNAAEANEQTDNWAGAVLKAPPEGDSFVDVSASFTVPGPPVDDETESAVSIWIGIDGYTNTIVVQAGVDVIEDEDGDVTFQAWVEWIPADTIYIDESDFAFTTGDVVIMSLATTAGSTTASVNFEVASSGEAYEMDFDAPDAGSAALAQNMEWMVERLHGPSGDDDVAPNLLNFNTIQFTGCMGTTLMGSTVDSSGATGVDLLAAGTDGLSATTVIDGQTVTVTWVSG